MVLTDNERLALDDNPGTLDPHDAARLTRKLNDALWEALLDIAREVTE